MKIFLQSVKKPYEIPVIEFLEQVGHEILLVESPAILRFFQMFCESEFISEEDEKVTCVILNIEDTRLLEAVLQVLESPFIYRRPRIILLSTLLTWAGKNYDMPIEGSYADFKSRVPAISAVEAYMIENRFYDMVTSTGADACILSMGLLYGGPGFDFEELLRSIWNGNGQTTSSILSTSDGNNVIPMIHNSDLARIIRNIIEWEQCLAPFIPATDHSVSSMVDIAKTITHVTKGNIVFTTPDEGINMVLAAPDLAFWTCRFPCFTDEIFTSLRLEVSFTSGMAKQFRSVWADFLATHSLQQCSLVIAGPAKTLKTNLAQSISDSLQIQFLDVAGCLKYVASAFEDPPVETALESERVKSSTHKKPEKGAKKGGDKGDDSHRAGSASAKGEETATTEQDKPPAIVVRSPDPMKAIPTEALKQAKHRLEKAMETQGGGGGGKSKAAKTKTEDTGENGKHVFSDALSRTLPAQLVRQCIAATIRSDLDCVRKGYVLDAWDWAVQGAADIRQVVGEKFPENADDSNHSSRPNTAPSRPASPADIIVSCPGSSSLQSSNCAMPELLIEIQTADSVVINRLQCQMMALPEGSAIPAKVPKEVQAAVKELEARQAQYSSLMEPMVDREPDPQQTQTPPVLSHRGVLELEQEGIVQVIRVDAVAESVQTVTANVKAWLVERHGPIGWHTDTAAIAEGLSLQEINRLSSPGIAYDGDQYVAGTSVESPWPVRVMTGTSNPMQRDASRRDVGSRGVNSSMSQRNSVSIPKTVVPEASSSFNGERNNIPRSKIEIINENINKLDLRDQKSVIGHCDQYQNYLVVNVLPFVSEGMIRIAREKPEDPIGFLAEFLRTHGVQAEEEASSQALAKFTQALSLAEQIDREIGAI
eukprot:gene289-523_t